MEFRLNLLIVTLNLLIQKRQNTHKIEFEISGLLNSTHCNMHDVAEVFRTAGSSIFTNPSSMYEFAEISVFFEF